MTKFQLNINSLMNIIVVVSQILKGYIKGGVGQSELKFSIRHLRS